MASNDEVEDPDSFLNADMYEMNQYIPDPDTTCTICHAEFLDPDDLKIHLNQVHKIASSVLRKCHFCPDEYTDLMAYAEHLRDVHVSSLKCCSKCWRVFDDFDEHRAHCRKHVINKADSSYSCSQCRQRYADVCLLKQHELEHKNAEGVMLHDVLPYLSAALKVKSLTFLEALDTDVVYICVGCEFSTVDVGTYLRHAKSNECKVYVCHKCCNVFKMKKSLPRHVLAECNIFGIKDRKTRYCPDCHTYVNVRTYSKHKIRCKPIKCYTCDITFATMNDWSEHQSQEHPAVSIEVKTCQYCWKRCVGDIAMKKHIEKTHQHEFHLYKYRCVYCDNVFKHPQKLFGHFISRHKDLTPYTCKICDKSFRFRKKFTIHIKLTHNSVGFVEFDEKYHVFFTDKKSEKPFIPRSILTNDMPNTSQGESENSEHLELNSDFMNVTETEGQTEAESKEKPRVKRKRTSNVRKEDKSITINLESSDDDESLLVVRKKVRLQKKKSSTTTVKKKRVNQSNKMVLTCNVCNKYCYTFQNYNHHISLHSKHEVKKCIKCSEIFKSKAKLNEHIATVHSSSRLTETLKTLLEKRKTGGSLTEDLPASVKFRRTVKKVVEDVATTCAKITEVGHKLSVQKFFENFVPEDSKADVVLDTTASIKLVTGYPREPTIKLTKFQPSPISTSLRLAMPVKFVDNYQEKTKISIKLVDKPNTMEETNDYYSDHYEEPDMDRHEYIPEVAEEVLLEGTEEAPKTQNDVAHKIVIPKLPTELTDIRIAHLLPQAPFYKIVKVKDVLEQTQEEKDEKNAVSSIQLADGTKLVTTNPLAHLLGKEQEKVLESVKNKYYKPKNKNLQDMLAKALTMLDKPSLPKKKKMKLTEVKIEDEN